MKLEEGACVLGVCVIDVLYARGGGEGAVVTNPTKQQ